MTLVIIYATYVLVGAIAGLLSGLLGIGGGVVTVPCFLLIFRYLDFHELEIMQIAVATSLAAMIFNTAAATWAHNRRQHVVWAVFKKLVPGLIAGSILGALVATLLPQVFLEVFFGFFLLALAYNFKRKQAIKVGAHQLPSPLILNILSCGIGALSNILGIGGGSLTVPMLTSYKMKDKNAIGTSAATTLVTTILGTITYLIVGWGTFSARDMIGLISVPAALVVGVVAFFLAPYGAKLTEQIDPNKVRTIFAIVLIITGLTLIF